MGWVLVDFSVIQAKCCHDAERGIPMYISLVFAIFFCCISPLVTAHALPEPHIPMGALWQMTLAQTEGLSSLDRQIDGGASRQRQRFALAQKSSCMPRGRNGPLRFGLIATLVCTPLASSSYLKRSSILQLQAMPNYAISSTVPPCGLPSSTNMASHTVSLACGTHST